MALDQRKRQKKLAKQRAKRKAKAAAQKPYKSSGSSPGRMLATLEFELASNAPVYECYVADEIFDREMDQGIGQVIVSRLSRGQVAAGIFMIDAFCLGVKDAFAFFRSREDFDNMLVPSMRQNMHLRKVEPAYAKKLILDAIAYARNNGFEPHKDYRLASKVLRDIDETTCKTEFTFGKDGKPFYITGPNDSEARSKQVINTLHRRFGSDGYHFMVGMAPFGSFFGNAEYDEDEWEGDAESDDEDDEEEENERRS
ncbi:MAG TPA: hypothetical protein VI260_29215 [Blastocatellia bacterium]|jgi:hypothetical protein